MIGWIIGGMIVATTAMVIVIKVKGIIDRQKLREEMREREIKNAVIEQVNRCENVVRVKDMDTGIQYDVKGNDISNGITVGSYL